MHLFEDFVASNFLSKKSITFTIITLNFLVCKRCTIDLILDIEEVTFAFIDWVNVDKSVKCIIDSTTND